MLRKPPFLAITKTWNGEIIQHLQWPECFSQTTHYTYVWWSGAKASSVTATGQTTGTSTYSYDANGYLYKLYDSGGTRTITYQTDIFGQVLTRPESMPIYTGAIRTFYSLNEHVIGDVGTDELADEIDYARQLTLDKANATVVPKYTYNVNPLPVVGFDTNFDVNYEAYNAASVEQASSSYTAIGGESLQVVAQTLWGDAGMWYLLADANGLDADTVLLAGQTLIVPGRNTNIVP